MWRWFVLSFLKLEWNDGIECLCLDWDGVCLRSLVVVHNPCNDLIQTRTALLWIHEILDEAVDQQVIEIIDSLCHGLLLCEETKELVEGYDMTSNIASNATDDAEPYGSKER